VTHPLTARPCKLSGPRRIIVKKVLEKSGLDWTIARPPKLTPKPYTGKYRVREGRWPPFGFSISHADVADFTA